MKTSTLHRPTTVRRIATFGFLFCLSAAHSISVAQTKPATTNESATSPKSEALLLSPFQVDASRDVGFVASSSLSGGRLALELKDTPIALSIITRDFVDAVGIVDLNDALNWSPNATEQIYAGGFSADISGIPSRREVRGRETMGNGSGRQQRNYFPYAGPMDSYAIERYELGRGPNAVLFGNGTLGGINSSTTKQARFDKDTVVLDHRLGTWHYNRTTLDVNKVLNERLAIRTAFVEFHRRGWRTNEMERNRAGFLTGTWKLRDRTTLRLEGEYGEHARRVPFSDLTEQFSGWDGVTVFSSRVDTLPANASALGINRIASASWVWNTHLHDGATVMNFERMAITLSGGATPTTPIGGFVQGSLPSFNTNNAVIKHAYNMPAGRFDRALANSRFKMFDNSFSMASDRPTIAQRYKDVQATLNHQFTPNLFLEVAADWNHVLQQTNTEDVRSSGILFIDINQNLPDGRPNPYYLDPYVQPTLRFALWDRTTKAARTALGYTRDFERWGNYQFSVLAGYTEMQDFMPYTRYYSLKQNADRRLWASGVGNDIIVARRYLSETSRPASVPSSVRLIDPIRGIDRTVTPGLVQEIHRADSWQEAFNEYKYGILALQGRYWKDRIVLSGALRSDEASSFIRQQVQAGDYPATTWDGITPIVRLDAPGDYAALSYIPKDANGNPTGGSRSADIRPRAANGDRLPQYANDRFRDGYNAPKQTSRQMTESVGVIVHVLPWLSPYMNYASTFNPPVPVQRIDTSFLPPTEGVGKDFGLRMTLLGGRINLNALHYRSTENFSEISSKISSNVNTVLQARPLPGVDTGRTNRNVRGLPDLPNFSPRDYQTAVANGYEFELTANVTRSWRMTVNLGIPETYAVDADQDAKRYMAEHGTTLEQIIKDTGAVVGSDGRASVDVSVPENQRSPDVASAVAAYNNLMTTRSNFLSGRTPSRGTNSANFYTDYMFRQGFLKNVSIGAGLQYRARRIIGARGADTIVNPANPAQSIDNPNVDGYTAVRAPHAERNAMLNVGYSKQLKDRRQLRLNLRVNNLLDHRKPLYFNTVLRPLNNDYTSPARETVPGNFTFRDPISFQLSARLTL